MGRVWDSPSAVQSLNPMVADCGLRTTLRVVPVFASLFPLRWWQMMSAAKANSIAQPLASPAWRYGLAFCSIATALGLARIFLHFHLPQPFAAFALSAIAITFWYGGTKAGILAALLASILRFSL